MKPHIRSFICFLSISLIISLDVQAAAVDSTQTFIAKSTPLDEFMIQSSDQALKKSRDSNIKLFAQKIINEQRQADNRLKAVSHDARSKAGKEPAIDKEYQQVLEQLNHQKSEKDFDALYIQSQKKANAELLDLFQSQTNNQSGSAIKSYAVETLPVLKKHQELINQIHAQ